MNSHYDLASTTGGDLLRKPMKQPLNGVAEIPQTMFEIFEVEYLRR